MAFKQTEVPYNGHLLTLEKMKADPSKIEAAPAMERPTAADWCIWRSAPYEHRELPSKLCRGCPKFQSLSGHSQRRRRCFYGIIHDRAFSRTKGVVTAPLVLKYYEWEKDLVSQGDASEGGLGAALLQDGRPLVYASREELCPNRERTSCDRVCDWKVSPVYL